MPSIASKSPRAMRLAKWSLNGVELLDIKKSHRFEQGFTLELYTSPDSQEARDAFVQKRDATFPKSRSPRPADAGSPNTDQRVWPWEGDGMARLFSSLSLLAIFLQSAPVRAGDPVIEVVLDDGQVHIVDGSEYRDVRVVLRDGPGQQQTELALFPDGEIGFGIRAEEHSKVSLLGGPWGGSVVATDEALVDIGVGVLEGALIAEDTATIRIFGNRFSLPLGDVEAEALTLAGHLINTPFSVDVQRSPGARVILEPGEAVIANDMANVIDAGNDYYDCGVEVRGLQTRVTVVDGGSVAFRLRVGTASVVVIEGGSVGSVQAEDDARVEIRGGAVVSGIEATGASLVEIDGGAVGGGVAASGTAALRVRGSDFNFPDGPLVDESGTLTGTLGDGSPISVAFVRAATATIDLPEPDAASVSLAAIASLALRCRGGRDRKR